MDFIKSFVGIIKTYFSLFVTAHYVLILNRGGDVAGTFWLAAAISGGFWLLIFTWAVVTRSQPDPSNQD